MASFENNGGGSTLRVAQLSLVSPTADAYCMYGTPSIAYPQSTLNSTPSCSSLSGTASYETYIAGQEESGCVTFVLDSNFCKRAIYR